MVFALHGVFLAQYLPFASVGFNPNTAFGVDFYFDLQAAVFLGLTLLISYPHHGKKALYQPICVTTICYFQYALAPTIKDPPKRQDLPLSIPTHTIHNEKKAPRPSKLSPLRDLRRPIPPNLQLL